MTPPCPPHVNVDSLPLYIAGLTMSFNVIIVIIFIVINIISIIIVIIIMTSSSS
jgi:hypothetical protein